MTSTSIFIRGSASPAEIIIAAGLISPKSAQDRPALGKVFGPDYDIRDANHVGEGGAGLLQRRLDVEQALLGLLGDTFRNRHRGIVEAGRAGHEHPFSEHHRA